MTEFAGNFEDYKRYYERMREICDTGMERIQSMDDLCEPMRDKDGSLTKGQNILSDDHKAGYHHAIEMAVMMIDYMCPPPPSIVAYQFDDSTPPDAPTTGDWDTSNLPTSRPSGR